MSQQKWSQTTCKEVWSDVVDKCGVPSNEKMNTMIDGIDQQIDALGTLKSAGICNVTGTASVDSSISFFKGLKNDLKAMTIPGASVPRTSSTVVSRHIETLDEREATVEDKRRSNVTITGSVPTPAPAPKPVTIAPKPPASPSQRVVNRNHSVHNKPLIECTVKSPNSNDICKCDNQATELIAKNNAFTDIPKCLLEKTWLRWIDLSGNQIRAIDHIPRVVHLNLSNNQIAFVGQTHKIPSSLTWIDLSSNKISGELDINDLTQLRYLNAANNKIIWIKGLGGRPRAWHGSRQITRLVLDNNLIKSLSGVKSLKHLKRLYASRNKFASIADVGISPDNKELYAADLSGNGMTNMTGISNGHLTYLYLHNNSIRDMAPVNAPRLRSLVIDNNKIGTISGLENATDLRLLRAPGNQISKITSIANLGKLKDINLASNKLEKIDTAAFPRKLSQVIIGGNPVNKFSSRSDDIQELRKRGASVSTKTPSGEGSRAQPLRRGKPIVIHSAKNGD